MLLTQFTIAARLRLLRTTPLLLYAGVLVVAAVLFFVRLGDRALWSMELRWAEIPREMQLSGDYVRPTINGRLYYDKPLGSYWLVIAAGRLTGRVDELTARLPSAVCGLAGVALLMYLARRLYGRTTAALAGLILATSFAYVFFARTASADIENVTGELAALALYLRLRRHPKGWEIVGLWLIMALTSLTKGLLGFALPLVVIVTHSTITSGPNDCPCGVGGWALIVLRRNRLLLNRVSAVGAVLAAVMYLAPFVASGGDAGRGLALVFRENLQRFVSPHNHRGPIYLYAYVIFGLMAPWSVFLPAALTQLHARRPVREHAAGDRFALVYFWATFAFFTLSASRRSYYLLPILPAGALLVARLLTASTDSLTARSRTLLRLGFGVLVVAVVASGVLLLPPAAVLTGRWAELPAAAARAIFALGWLACLAGVLIAWRNIQPGRVARVAGLVASLAMAYVFGVVLPALEPYRGERPFALAVREVVGHDPTGLALYRTRELVYYLGYAEPIAEFDTREHLAAATAAGQVRWVILRRRDLEGLELPANIVAEEPSHPWEDAAEWRTKAVLLRPQGKRGKSLY